jgi:hypothetical protein
LPAVFYQTVQVNGITMPQQTKLQLIGSTNLTINCNDNTGNNSTDCTFVSTASSGGTPRTCNANGCYRINADGTIEQWATEQASFTNRGGSIVYWPIPFPNVCSQVQTTVQFNNAITSTNWQGVAYYVQPGDCRTYVSMYHDIRGDGSVDAPFHALVYGIGW